MHCSWKKEKTQKYTFPDIPDVSFLKPLLCAHSSRSPPSDDDGRRDEQHRHNLCNVQAPENVRAGLHDALAQLQADEQQPRADRLCHQTHREGREVWQTSMQASAECRRMQAVLLNNGKPMLLPCWQPCWTWLFLTLQIPFLTLRIPS